MKRKIVITGISSAIMQKLCLLIDLSEYEVTGITRNPDSTSLDNIKIVKGDLHSIQEFAHYFKGCYMVIHGAAVTHSRNEKKYYRVNLEATKGLVELANDQGVKRFIYVSTNTAGTKSGAYGLTKLLAEQYIQENFNGWTILRLSEVYGGSISEGIEKLIVDVIDKSYVLCPVGIPSKFYPIHIDDTAQVMHSRIFNDTYQNNISVINGPDGFSFFEVIELTKTISGRKIKVIFLNRKLMFLIKFIARMLPVNLGMVPDQVDRLYSIKHYEKAEGYFKKMEAYIEKLVRAKVK
jgi:nucleoside-diphosphate-sugar epimerase